MKRFKKFAEEMGGFAGGAGAVAPINNVGGGNIAGVGIGVKGEPGVPGKVLRRKKLQPLSVDKVHESTFMGHQVFEVDGDVYHKSRFGKKKYSRWAKETGGNEDVSTYGRKTRKPIIVTNKSTGAMQFFRHPKDKKPL